MYSRQSFASFSGMFARATAASLMLQEVPEQAEDSGATVAPLQEDVVLAVQAELEERQEARRHITVRGGKIFHNKGSSSEDEEEQQQQEPGAGTGTYSINSSPTDSRDNTLSGGTGVPPSTRYWRDRATLSGGRLSVEAHAARLRERHQVQAELRAWCEEVLEGQQDLKQQRQLQGQDADAERTLGNASTPASTTGGAAGRRWSELPSNLYNAITGQASPRRSHHHKHHQHHRRSSMAMVAASAPGATRAFSTGATDCQQQSLRFSSTQQQQQEPSSCTASCTADGGCLLAPCTAEAFEAELQSLQAIMQRKGQQQILQQQQQQGNEAELQLSQQQLQQQQLAQAHQQIAALTGQAAAQPTVLAMPGTHSATPSAALNSPSEKQPSRGAKNLAHLAHQQEVWTQPGPNVQVLTIIRNDSSNSIHGNMQGHCSQAADAIELAAEAKAETETMQLHGSTGAPQPAASVPQQQQHCTRGTTSDLRNDQTATAATPKRRTIATLLPPAAAATSAAAAVGSDENRSLREEAPAGTKLRGRPTSRRPTGTGFVAANGYTAVVNGSSSAISQPAGSGRSRSGSGKGAGNSALDQQLLSPEQQQALVERLKHAEGVMQMLQADLEVSLAAQHQLSQQLEQQQAALQEARSTQKQQQNQQQGVCQATSGSASEQQQQQQHLSKSFAEMMLQLATSKQEVAEANKQLHEVQQQCLLREQQLHEQQVQEAGFLQQVQLLQQRAEQQMKQLQEQLQKQRALEQQVVQLQQQLEQQAVVEQQLQQQLQQQCCQETKETGLQQQIQQLQKQLQQQQQQQQQPQELQQIEQQERMEEFSEQTRQLEEALKQQVQPACMAQSTQHVEHDSIATDSVDASSSSDTVQAHATSCNLPELQHEQPVQAAAAPDMAAVQPLTSECTNCQQLKLQIQQLQQQQLNDSQDSREHKLQHNAVQPSAGDAPAPAVSSSSEDGPHTCMPALNLNSESPTTSGRCTKLSPRKQPLQQQLPLKTILCPPVPAQQAPTAVAAGYGGVGDVQTARSPAAQMQAGVRKMRPFSYNRPPASGESYRFRGVVGTSIASGSTPAAAAAASDIWQQEWLCNDGAQCQKQLLEDLMRGQFAVRDRSLQPAGSSVVQGVTCKCSCSDPGVARRLICGKQRKLRVGNRSAGSTDAGQVEYSDVQCRSRSPTTARPASAISRNVHSATGAACSYTLGPRRPQTARCMPGQPSDLVQYGAAMARSAVVNQLATDGSNINSRASVASHMQKVVASNCSSVTLHGVCQSARAVSEIRRRPESSSSKPSAVPRLKLGAMLLSNS